MALNTWNRVDRWLFLRPATLVGITFTSLFGRCKAQQESTNGSTTTLILIIAAGVGLSCLLSMIIFAIWYVKRKRKNTAMALPTTSTRYAHNIQTQLSFPQSQASDQSSLQYRLQSNVSPLSRVIYSASSPTSNVSNEASQTVPQASEPVSLPEATLHQGEAPPGYAEAVKMKTICAIYLPQY